MDIKWSSVNSRMEALIEELDEDERFVEAEEELEEDALSEEGLQVVAELAGLDLEDLYELDEEELFEMMQNIQTKVIAGMAYGRPGLSGKHPWSRNEKQVGYSVPTQPPSRTSAPSTRTAKVPKASGSPMFQKGRPHIKK